MKTGNHPVFLGPSLFHFTKDQSTFTRFALELQARNSEIRKLKKVGLDMEGAIFQGIKHFFPDIKQLYCVRHLMKRDEMRLDKLFGRMKCSAAEKNKGKSEILKDIYMESGKVLYINTALQSHVIVMTFLQSLIRYNRNGKVNVQDFSNGLWRSEKASLLKVSSCQHVKVQMCLDYFTKMT